MKYVILINTILTIALLIYLFKSYQVITFKYENTYKEELLENFKPIPLLSKVVMFVVGVLLIINILIPATHNNILFSRNSITDEKVELVKELTVDLYQRNPANLKDEDLVDSIYKHVRGDVVYKILPESLNNLQERHLNWTSDKTKLEFISVSANTYQVNLVYKLTNPNNETRLMMSITEFEGDRISDYNEFVLSNSVVY